MALVPLYAALDAALAAGAGARRAFALGWWMGLAFYLIGMHWMLFLSEVAIEVPWLKYPAWLLSGAYLAVFPGIAAAGAVALVRRTGAPLALVLPAVWLVVEGARGAGELGFPWFQPGYTQHDFVPLLQMASLGGVTLVTAWLLFLNGLLWRAWAGPDRGRAAVGAALALALPLAWGMRAMDAAPRGEGPRVALVQGNIAGEIKWSGRHQEEILAKFLSLSRDAVVASPPPDLVVWPETATGSYLAKQPEQARAVASFVARSGVPIYAGYADWAVDEDGARRFHNAAGVFTTRGAAGTVYAKRHLVPFGERMPFQWLVPALGRVELGQAEWTAGTAPVLYRAGGVPFSGLICFESIFPRLAREDVRAGARWLVNITNDEWFGNSAALYQHAAMARFRAVENRVPLARCANTGLTMLIDAYGRVVERLPVFEDAVLSAPVPPPGPATWWTRVGDWPTGVALLAVAVWTALAFAGRRRRGGGEEAPA